MAFKFYFLDIKNQRLYYGGKVIFFTKKEFLMIHFLIEQNRVVYIDELVNHVWEGKGSVITNNNISQLTYKIRKKLLCIKDDIIFNASVNNGGVCKFKSNIIRIKNKVIYLFIFHRLQ